MRYITIASFFKVTGFLSSIFMTLLPSVVLSRPLIINSRYPEVPNSDTNALFCYLQTTDGRTLDLDSLCKKTSGGNTSSSVRPSSVRPSSSGSNLGAGQCYAFDAAGRPCGATTNEERQNNTIDSVPTNPIKLP